MHRLNRFFTLTYTVVFARTHKICNRLNNVRRQGSPKGLTLQTIAKRPLENTPKGPCNFIYYYSVLKAVTGFLLAADKLGRMPAVKVNSTLKPTMIIATHHGSAAMVPTPTKMVIRLSTPDNR